MRPIDKFILHVAHNWRNELNEAYGKAQLQKFIDHFKEDADGLNIQVSEEQIKKYIEAFDKLRQRGGKFSVDPITLTLPQLIKLVTSVASDIDIDEEDQTPDVVYHEGPITIWNGNKNENCLTYGSGGRWCITRGSWAGHRYNANYSFPTFYIAKNTSLPDGDLISWIVIAVREDGQYVLHKRNNQPNYPEPESFSRLLSQVPWLADIPNIQRILKYQPLSTKEKLTQKYSISNMNIREWISSTFNFKKQYLVVRSQSGSNPNTPLFSDITNDNFVKKVLPKYPNIADFISVTEGVLNPIMLLCNLDNFTPQQRKSITANLHQPIDVQYLKGEYLPFDVKVLLTKLNKWNLGTDKRVYVTDDNSTIVELILNGDNSKINLHQEEDDFDNIKITPRTAKYITQYPDLEKLPLNFLIKLTETGLISQDLVRSVIDKAKESDSGAMVVKEINGIEILLDSNTLSSYKIEDGKITKIPFSDELVQQAFVEESDNENFQKAGIRLFNLNRIPDNIDKDALLSIISSTPPEKRIINGNLVLTSNDPEYPFGKIELGNNNGKGQIFRLLIATSNWRYINDGMFTFRNEDALRDYYRSYFQYLNARNVTFTGDEIITQINETHGGRSLAVKAFIEANPPIAADSQIIPALNDGYAVFINRNNPRVARQYNPSSGRFRNVNLSPAESRRLLRGNEETGEETPTVTPTTTPTIQGEPGERRRGRPAGVPNAPRTEVPTAITGGGDINVSQAINGIGLSDAFSNMNRRDRQRLNVTDAVRENPNGDRGAARRNNQLGAAGRVTNVISVGPSKIYFITLRSGGIIASINMQPGNRNYLLLQNGTVVTMESPSELMSALQQRQLAEVRHYMVHDYLHHNPHHLDEVRELLRQHEAKRK